MFEMLSIKAGRDTSLSTFQMRQEGNNIIVFPGEYICQNEVLAQTTEEKKIAVPLEPGHYELWLYKDGSMKFEKDYVTVDNYIDCLLFIEMPAGAKSLDDAQITFKQFVEVV